MLLTPAGDYESLAPWRAGLCVPALTSEIPQPRGRRYPQRYRLAMAEIGPFVEAWVRGCVGMRPMPQSRKWIARSDTGCVPTR
jgi:hypothetical protein